jgi:N-acyl-D-amino-acid deacylase
MKYTVFLFLIAVFLMACGADMDYDIVIRNGTIYDGSGSEPYIADIAISADSIAAIGPDIRARSQREIDAEGKAVSPGFINMLSWATDALIEDGLSQSDIRQGVTLEVFGEGWSYGPLNEKMKRESVEKQWDVKYDIEWTTLGEYLEYLVSRGVSTNVASFLGATTVRVHELGYEDRAPTPEELDRMKSHVRTAMEEGALGIGSALIYAPAFYAETDELIELCKVASEYGGMYVSHIRSEGNRLLESLDELILIAKEADIPAEIYHLKAAGVTNWTKLDDVIRKVESARDEGLQITADMYTYTAAMSGLDAAMPPWVQEGGHDEWVERLKDPAVRERVMEEMRTPSDEWENYYLASGPEKVLLAGFKSEVLKLLTGMTLAEVAESRGKTPEETAIELVIEDDSRVSTVFFFMSEENVKKKIALPWVTFCSDEESQAPEGVFLKSNPHPRCYGTFARLLGKYVRDEEVIPLEEAIRKLTSLPADNLKIKRRGLLKPGYFADIVVFDPDSVRDHATYEKPHQYSTGVIHVFVNGTQVFNEGMHTGARPGRVVRGPGWRGFKGGSLDE